jgi:hypothetical protein
MNCLSQVASLHRGTLANIETPLNQDIFALASYL